MTHSRRTFMAAAAQGTVGAGLIAGAETAADTTAAAGKSFTLRPIGVVEKPAEGRPRIRIAAPFTDGLLGLENWSHVVVLYWFDRNDVTQKRAILQVHPQGNAANPLTGVFACRSPVRPNLIAFSVCKIVSVAGGVVTVEALDAFDGTPVVDLKPYTPADAPKEDVKVPDWARRGKPAGEPAP